MQNDSKNVIRQNRVSASKNQRFIAMFLFVCIISVTFLSGMFILTHTDHEHDHDGFGGTCATCAHIASAENILKQVSTALITSGAVLTGLFILISILKSCSFESCYFTLVKLKVRMNN